MAKPKKEADAAPITETVAVEKPKAKKGGFVVLDSNGKAVRTVDTIEEAQALVAVYAGRVQK